MGGMRDWWWTGVTSSVFLLGSLHFSLLLPPLPLLCSPSLLKVSPPFPALLLLLPLQRAPLLRQSLGLGLECLAVEVGIHGVGLGSLELGLELFHVCLGTHLPWAGYPFLETGEVEGQLLVLHVVIVWERADGTGAVGGAR